MPLTIDAESADALQAPSHGFLSYEGITAASAFDVSAFCSPSVPLATWSSVLLPAGRAGAAQGLALCNGALALPTALRGAFGGNLSSAAAVALSDVARLPLSMSLLAAFCYFAPRQLRTEGGEALLPQMVTVLRLAVERLAQQRMGGEAALAVGAAAEAAISRATSRRQLQKGDVQAILAFLLRSGRRAPLLRLISHSPLVHEAAAGAACDAIGAAGEARSDALSLLCECVCQLPHAPLGCVGFLHEVARRRPALVAAGFESGVVHEAVHTALQNTPGRQKVAVQKATLSLLTHVLEALPRTSLHPRSLQQMVGLLWGRASDEQAEAASRAHALSELSELIEGFQVYPPSASAAYVRRFSSVLQLLHADGTSSKLIHSRATALLVTLFAHAPWRRQEDTEERVAEGGGEAVPLDLEGSGEAHGAEYAAWVRCVRRHFPLLLRLAVVEPAVLQLLLHARLSAEEVRAVADAAARADGEAEAAAMRSLLRAHVIAGGWAAAAARLLRLAAAYTPTQCRVLLDAARLSEAEVAGLAAALFGEARGGGATGCELLACCAMLWAGAVVRLVPLGWVEERIDQIVLPGPIPRGAETTGFASCHEAHECVRPLLHLLNALLRAGASSHSTLQWLDERAATAADLPLAFLAQFLERGFVRPTIDSLFAFAPSTSRQLTCRALAKLRAAATDSPPCARLLMRALGHAAYRAAELASRRLPPCLARLPPLPLLPLQLCSERTLEALRSDPIFHQLGFVRSAALDGSAAAEYRAAAGE
ncbi:hypothetical protein AB1Y20_006344 [Prymnesium parvum]|uniref:Uncharacterized protein n=1 Tax=Prymnesium parvum TaxID=97485 RepID=A0AB34J4I0_PRYPA